MPSRTLAIVVVLVLWGLARGAESTLDGETRGVDAKDWPTYNCDVLGWRHNAGETALSRTNVGRLEEKWRFPPKGADFEIGVIHATSVVVNGCVYFGTANKATFYKLTPDGKLKWSFPLNEKNDRVNQAEVGIVNGIYGSALVTEDAVYFGTIAGFVYALDRDTGKEKWRVDISAYLRHHEAARREYEALKRAVYAQHPADIEAYNDGKGAWNSAFEPLALEWYRRWVNKPEQDPLGWR